MRCGNNTWTPWRSTLKRSTELSRMLQRTWPVHDWKREHSLLQLNRITWPAGWECIHAILTEYCDSLKYMYMLMSDPNHRLIAWKAHLSTIVLYVKWKIRYINLLPLNSLQIFLTLLTSLNSVNLSFKLNLTNWQFTTLSFHFLLSNPFSTLTLHPFISSCFPYP